MTNAPDPGNEPEPTTGQEPELPSIRSVQRRSRRRVGIVLSLILLAGIGGGAAWAWFFIQRQLAPMVEKNIARLLNRPVNLGQIESFSFNGLRFGASKVPATATDPDRASVEAVDVAFNPLQLIFTRTLELDITLLNPDVYIEQDKERRWVSTEIQSQEKGPIDVKLQVLRLRNADVSLVPRSQAGKLEKPVAIALPSGMARFLNDNQLIQFDLGGQVVKGGEFQLKGESRPKVQETNLLVSGSDMRATELSRLLQLPLGLQAGQLDGNLEIQIKQDQPLQFLGTATLENVTARVTQLPKPFTKINGLLRFKGTQVRLEKVTTLFGQIPAEANGLIDTQKDFNLSARTQPVQVKQVLQAFNFQKLPVTLSGEVQAALRVTGALSKPIVSGEVVTTKVSQIDRVNFRAISSGFRLADSTLTVRDLRATPMVGGLVRANGKVELDKTRSVVFDVQATNVPGEAIARSYNVKLPVPIGLVSARTQISTSLNNPQNLRATGSANLNVAGGTITATNVRVAGGRFETQVQASGVQLRLAQLPPQLRGSLSGNFNLAGSLASFSPSTIRGSGSGSLNVAGGTVTARNVRLDKGRFEAQVETAGVQLERLAQVPPQLRGPLSGRFNLSGSLASFSPSTIRGSGSGSLNVAGGTVIARNVRLDKGRFEAQVETARVQLERLAQVPPQLRGSLSGIFNFSGSLTSFSSSTIRGSGSGRLNVAGGAVTATNVQLANGRFQADVEPRGVQLAGFSQDLRGRLSGKLNVTGSLTALSPAAIRVRGQLAFSEGIALIDRALTASISWNGQQLRIQQATAEGFNANGVVNVNLANSGLQAIRSFNLNVQARDLNLQKLPIVLPNSVSLAGQADFEGSIAGTPTAPNVNGNLQLHNLVAAGLEFDPLLTGRVNAVPGQGVKVRLGEPNDDSGTEDTIIVDLAPNYRPVYFLVRADGAFAEGTRQGEQLVVKVEEFPIALLKQLTPLPSAIATQPISGDLSGNLAVNLNTYGISGDVAITKPVFGSLVGDSFTGRFQYANGNIEFREGNFKKGDNQYLLSGNLTQSPNGPQFDAKLQVDQGELQDVLTALQIFDLTDLSRGFNAPIYGNSADINVGLESVGSPTGVLQTQLQRLSEIEALLEQQRQQRETASPIPEFRLAKGRFTGSVNVVGSLTTGINAEFDIQGDNWEWGSYSAKEVTAQGNFQDGILTLLPLRFESDDSVLSYSGTIGGDAQSGQLRLVNIPIAGLQQAFNLPPAVGFTGFLNATATLAGSIANPTARGELTLTDATLNQTPVQAAQGSFSYNNARLNFGSTILIAATDPLSIDGSFPYKLPFASVRPANNQLSLNIDVQNEGLALLNLLTRRQVTWVDGTGDVNLKITGTYDQEQKRPLQLVAEGIATVENATIKAVALPEPLTNVAGRVLFNFDRIEVQTVQGQFSGGTVTAAGTLPIAQSAPQENPLKVNIGELALNLKGLYNGRVQGGVLITGSALEPKIAGEVELFDGQVELAERAADTGGSGGTSGESGSSNSTEFNGLRLTLGKGVQITRAPILNFLANGSLTLNGSLDDIRPEGTIRLQRGQVNLFTTQFRLARGYENTAQFLPERGLDPILDVRLQASVAEATQRRLPTDPLSAEISDAPTIGFGSVQTVRIQARVEGPASQLADSIELTSTPARSEPEIVALLGGGFVDTLGRGDSTLGLANLAGSAILSNVQNIIGDALGLSEFRLFPTLTTDDEKRTSTLGLAAEAGLDITRNFSVSVLKELTSNKPFEYSLRYRLNDDILLRGATDLSGESRAVVEYERRF